MNNGRSFKLNYYIIIYLIERLIIIKVKKRDQQSIAKTSVDPWARILVDLREPYGGCQFEMKKEIFPLKTNETGEAPG